jgi:hypothetical protein
MNQETLIINGCLQQINEDAIEILENMGYPYEKAVLMVSEVDAAEVIDANTESLIEDF